MENVCWYDSKISIPKEGSFIKLKADKTLEVPNNPIIPFIQGDGIGPEITPQMIKVINKAMSKAYNGSKVIYWVEVLAGDMAEQKGLERMPKETLELLKQSIVSIKGPLGTPVGKGGKSLNAILRQSMDFYSAIRPVYWMGQPSPIPNPQRVNVAVFRENSDDVYMAIEYMPKTDGFKKVREFFVKEMSVSEDAIPEDAGITVKPMSEFKTKRHVRKAFRYALQNGKKHIAVAGKGNIMKATEGMFMNWAFEVAKEPEFEGKIITEGEPKEGQAKLYKVITDQMLMQLVLNPDYYDVIITQNLNGDYISDLASALVGGPGYVPSGNIGDGYALFESTHGTAYDIAGKGMANPLSITLSGAMMLEYLGFYEAADLVYKAIKSVINQRKGTPDIANGFKKMGVEAISLTTSQFGDAIVDEIDKL
ncbi:MULTISPECIES: NADP-dependent isocitrate dehydrogenase [unclassified Hydrogenobaculum]|jgi:isocitrate dehydrogenase (NADP) (EC 1.1.1.42)|uniref:NADP-dependent isocitrate dehydrogenase n=1 Tax=unclassified Hydrogenobaculum TaxID=2622382 RepID=UPI0001C51A28|nr:MULTISPECIES: NADP-dependent isocitrate dehydrogenase [unclassified Hydrogenobaculum]AEF19787.1 Isocitrate dehydrogenase (NADP(+)) [Hydrogenobaculum sp. 3684]AEG47074.1 Isocitrate dehydrogenase (NADP(+)) [Hydrogenobaculum sp. SHO]AGG15722.1 Isocitrate dehydrogenase (NADP(+)) [Hydrogenobaculum sp. HO]AGH94022.1 isocitrate dehydrogenase [Hydrogenobaculum sp. SN]